MNTSISFVLVNLRPCLFCLLVFEMEFLSTQTKYPRPTPNPNPRWFSIDRVGVKFRFRFRSTLLKEFLPLRKNGNAF